MRRVRLLLLPALALALLAGCAAPAGETTPPSDSPAVTAPAEPDFPRVEAADLEHIRNLNWPVFADDPRGESAFGYLLYQQTSESGLRALCAADGSWYTDYCFTEIYETEAGAAGFLAPEGEELLCYDTAGSVIFDSRDFPAVAASCDGARGFLYIQEGYFPQRLQPASARPWELMDLQGNYLPLPEGGRLGADPCMSLGLTAVEVDGRWGYWDGTAWAIEPRYASAAPFQRETGLAVVKTISGLYQAVDAQGRVAFESAGRLEIHPLPDGSWYYRVKNPDAVDWYDHEGQPVEEPFPWPAEDMLSPLIPGDYDLVLPLRTAEGHTLVTEAGEPVLSQPCDWAEVLCSLDYQVDAQFPENWNFFYSLKKDVYDPEHPWSDLSGCVERYAICAADGSWCTDFLFSQVCDTPLGALGILAPTGPERLTELAGSYAVCYDQAGNVIFDSRDWELSPELLPNAYSLVNSLTREGIFTLADGSLLDVRTGRVHTPPAGVSVMGRFACGLAPAQNEEGLWGYVDKNFRWVIPPQYDQAESFYPDAGVAVAGTGPITGLRTLYLIDTAGNPLGPEGRNILVQMTGDDTWFCTVTDAKGAQTDYNQDMQPLEPGGESWGLPMDRIRSTPDENGICRYYRRDIVTGALYLYQLTVQETGAEVYDLEGNLLAAGANPFGTPTAGLFPCTQDGFQGWKDESGEWRVKSRE